MNTHARILNAFYATPWNIRIDAHVSLGRILHSRLTGEQQIEEPRWRPASAQPGVVGPVDERGQPMIPQMEIVGRQAVIPVRGVLGRHMSFLALWCGGCDYSHIEQMIDIAEADPSVERIVFDFRTPGGSSVGNPECAARVAAIAKPTLGYTDQECCSAGYYLSSQCDEIVFAPSSIVGSIGSYLALVDESRAWEMAGLKLELLRSGPHKGSTVAGHALDEKERAHLLDQVLFSANTFKADVLRARPGVEAHLHGGWFFGAQAVELGLADATAPTLAHALAAAEI